MRDQHFIGIEIGGTKLQIVSANADLKIEQYFSFPVDRKGGAAGILDQIEETVLAIKKDVCIKAIGIGYGGPVNHKTGMVAVSHQIAGWENINLKKKMEGIAAAPVCVENDANVAALAEAVRGAGAGYGVVFYMTIGSGIGGGIVIDGKIYHGNYPGEVEVGHLRLNKNGDTLESLCSGWAVDEQIRAAIKGQPKSILAELVREPKGGEARFLIPAIKRGDETAKTVLRETADNIAFALSHVVHLFHPHIIVIGGGLSLAGEYFREQIASALPLYLMKAFLPAPEIKIALLGKDVVPIGALELAKNCLE